MVGACRPTSQSAANSNSTLSLHTMSFSLSLNPPPPPPTHTHTHTHNQRSKQPVTHAHTKFHSSAWSSFGKEPVQGSDPILQFVLNRSVIQSNYSLYRATLIQISAHYLNKGGPVVWNISLSQERQNRVSKVNKHRLQITAHGFVKLPSRHRKMAAYLSLENLRSMQSFVFPPVDLYL